MSFAVDPKQTIREHSTRPEAGSQAEGHQLHGYNLKVSCTRFLLTTSYPLITAGKAKVKLT